MQKTHLQPFNVTFYMFRQCLEPKHILFPDFAHRTTKSFNIKFARPGLRYNSKCAPLCDARFCSTGAKLLTVTTNFITQHLFEPIFVRFTF